jgi:hypothetical protein
MKLILRFVLGASLFFCGYVQANDSDAYSKVVSVGGNGVTVRHTQSNWLYGINYSLSEADSDYSGSETASDITVIIGRRFYLDNNDVRSFIDSDLRISHDFSDYGANSYGIFTGYGLEQVLSEVISVGGAIGITLHHYDTGNYKSTSLSGPSGRIFVSYYFN